MGDNVDGTVLLLELALDDQEGLAAPVAALSGKIGVDDHVHQPRSSSISRKVIPLAVPGRCRQTINPAIWMIAS